MDAALAVIGTRIIAEYALILGSVIVVLVVPFAIVTSPVTLSRPFSALLSTLTTLCRHSPHAAPVDNQDHPAAYRVEQHQAAVPRTAVAGGADSDEVAR
jgi:hypothetical protein